MKAEFELDDKQLVTLAATVGYCILMGLEKHMPDTSPIKEKIRGVEDALKDLAQLNSCVLDKDMTDVGMRAWGAAMQRLQNEMIDIEKRTKKAHKLLDKPFNTVL